MSDDDLRSLERAATAGGASERLAWARALERAGKRDEALDALLPSRDDATVRREIGKFPAWSHARGDSGHSGFLDAPPLERAPRATWSQRVPGPERNVPPRVLLASPLVVVARYPSEPPAALDAITGRVLWQLPWSPGEWETAGDDDVRLSLAGDVVIVSRPRRVVAHDAWTGEPLWSRSASSAEPPVLDHGVVVSVVENDIVIHAHPDPRSPFGPHAWRDKGTRQREVRGLALTRGRLVVALADGVDFFELAPDVRLARRFRAESMRSYSAFADAWGAVVFASNSERDLGVVRAFRASTQHIWTDDLGSDNWVFAISRRLVLTRHYSSGSPPALRVLDRETGRELARPGGRYDCVVRDSIILHSTTDRGAELAALRPDGEVVWRFESEALPATLVPGQRAFFFAALDGTITCLA